LKKVLCFFKRVW